MKPNKTVQMKKHSKPQQASQPVGKPTPLKAQSKPQASQQASKPEAKVEAPHVIRTTPEELLESQKRAAEDDTKYKAIVLQHGAALVESLTVKTDQVGRDRKSAKVIGELPVRQARTAAEAIALHGDKFVTEAVNATYNRAVGAGARMRYNALKKSKGEAASFRDVLVSLKPHQGDGVGLYDGLAYGKAGGFVRDAQEAELKRGVDLAMKALSKASPSDTPAAYRELQAATEKLFQYKQSKSQTVEA